MKWRTCLLVLPVLVLPGTASAWNAEGHELVVEIAMQVQPSLRARMGSVLRDMMGSAEYGALVSSGLKDRPYFDGDRGQWIASLATDPARAGTFADWIKDYVGSGPYSGDHYINYSYEDGAGSNPFIKPRNGETMLATYLKRLPSDTGGAKAWSLAWVLHIVGDLHQPWHCVTRRDGSQRDGHDSGGNYGQGAQYKDGNLHAYWDGLPRQLAASGDSIKETAKKLLDSTKADTAERDDFRAKCKELDPHVWTQESLALAREIGYPNERKNTEYDARAKVIARWQILLAGSRLAALLDARLPK